MSLGMLIGIIALIVVGGAVALIVTGLRTADDVDPLEERLLEYATAGETVSLEEVELSQSFAERIVLPLARRFGELALRFTPQNAIQDTARKIEKAGNPRRLDPTLFWALRIFGLSLGILILIVASIAPPGSFLTGGRAILIGLVMSLLGFYVPELWLRSRINRRQKEVRRALPDALDLLTICVEAGLGFDSALDRVRAKWDNELSLIFARVLREIQLGKVKRDALRDMSDRVDIPELSSFVAAVIQSEQLGVSMANVLRVQSDAMRIKRRQLAEEEAQKAPIKMLFPMAFLIFPSLLIILLGPAALILLQSALGGVLF